MNGKYKDFQSSLEFLLDYGFEFSKDSATGRHKCYKNEYGEIVLRYKKLDPNYYVPQICIEIPCCFYKKLFSQLHFTKRYGTIYVEVSIWVENIQSHKSRHL